MIYSNYCMAGKFGDDNFGGKSGETNILTKISFRSAKILLIVTTNFGSF